MERRRRPEYQHRQPLVDGQAKEQRSVDEPVGEFGTYISSAYAHFQCGSSLDAFHVSEHGSTYADDDESSAGYGYGIRNGPQSLRWRRGSGKHERIRQ